MTGSEVNDVDRFNAIVGQAIGQAIGSAVTVVSAQPVSGGSINEVTKLSLSDGQQVLLKLSGDAEVGFESEAQGLAAIAATETFRVPELIAVGQVPRPYLLMEWIESASPQPECSPQFSQRLGQQLAALHAVVLDDAQERFGYHADNIIGATPQMNTPTDSWSDFFCDQRLRFQFNLAVERGFFSGREVEVFERLLINVSQLLGAVSVTPSLIHGDLWSGNCLCDIHQQPVLIDPAVSWSHSEAEFGIMHMFGGFMPEFYDAYHHHRPAADGSEQRIEIYSLYHFLNHLNLFGRDYLADCWRIIKKYA